MLLEEGDYTRSGKEATNRNGFFSGIYWSLVTAVYLAWGFLSKNWNDNWIVWPVAGVAYGAVYGIAQALRKR